MSSLSDFKEMLPYASELVGVYQPILGWKSNQGKMRVSEQIVETVSEIYDGMINDPALSKYIKVDLNADSIPIKVTLPDLSSFFTDERFTYPVDGMVANKARSDIEKFIEENGRAPTSSEFKLMFNKSNMEKSVINAYKLPSSSTMDTSEGLDATDSRTELRGIDLTMARHRSFKSNTPSFNSEEALSAALLNYLSNKVDSKVFLNKMPGWAVKKEFLDPLADFDPATIGAVLSPVGLVHLYRQYFFEFETFLGSPVGHVWVSPGGSVELFEVNTRRSITERTVESMTETITRSEKATMQQDDLADAVKVDNSRNMQIGINASGGVNTGVYHAEATASLGYENANRSSEETMHKHTRQQSEKLSSEIRTNFKTTFRTMTETEDTSSRRHVLQNTTNKLVNYELRRKMRKVGVQVQHIGTQLCWQVYVDRPGDVLGVAEFVHAAEPEDLQGIQPPDAPVALDNKETDYEAYFPFQTTTDNRFPTDLYVGGEKKDGSGVVIGKIVSNRVYYLAPPAVGYTLSNDSMQLGAPRGSKEPDKWFPEVTAKCELYGDHGFKIILDRVNFNGNPGIYFPVHLIWYPPDQNVFNNDAQAAYKKKIEEYTEAKTRKAHEEYVTAVRERIKMVSGTQPRPSDELREEERIVVYRRLIGELMKIDKFVPHVTAELIRALFDVDKMLYFVAPEWWLPRKHERQQIAEEQVKPIPDKPFASSLGPSDKIGWGGVDAMGRDNYLITEESQQAKLGSSLGWLLQLDGDDQRNAFLNSPWVKAVIPIRPGREAAALKWLQLAHVEGTDGLDANYGGDEEELAGNTIAQALQKLAKKIAKTNTDMDNTLATETVYEKGFNPLDKGFIASGKPCEIFDQWIEVLPTDQVVALEYDAEEHI